MAKFSGLNKSTTRNDLDEVITSFDSHNTATDNPHGVTQTQVGLDAVDNTSDADKPVSTAQQSVLDGKLDDSQLVTAFQETPDDTHFVSEKLTKDSFDLVQAGLDTLNADDATENSVDYKVKVHTDKVDNPHGVTQTQVGLGDVTNDAQLKIASNLDDLQDKEVSREKLGVKIGTDVQAYDVNIVSDANYVHTDNNYTSDEVTKIGHLAVTQDVDLDIVKAEIAKFNSISYDTNEPTGFIREQIGTVGMMEVTHDGTNVMGIGIHGQSEVWTRDTGKFYDDTDCAVRTFRIIPKRTDDDSGGVNGTGTLDYYIEGKKYVRTEGMSCEFPDTSGMHYFYFGKDGELHTSMNVWHDAEDNDNPNFFEDTPVVSVMYYNKDQNRINIFGDERHGITMDGFTHLFWHVTFGTQYAGGMDIDGIVEGEKTHGTITSGHLYDEDLYMPLPTQTTTPMWYAAYDDDEEKNLWYAEAGQGTDTIALQFEDDDYVSYNEFYEAGKLKQTQLTEDQFTTVFFLGTNSSGSPYISIAGQMAYDDLQAARDAIENEINFIKTTGLPTPEFLFIGCVLVNAVGEVQTLSDGGVYLDLRHAKTEGSSAVSGVTTKADDISYDGRNSTVDATTVKTAIDELDIRIIHSERSSAVLGTQVYERYDKMLGSMDILEMSKNSDGNLDLVRYTGDDTDTPIYYRDVMEYDSDDADKLVKVKHYYGTIDLDTTSGETVLAYDGDDLNTTSYTDTETE